MSNKEIYHQDIVLKKQKAHIERTLEELKYVEIKKTEYERIKKSSPKGYGETLRWGYRYYKKKENDKSEIEFLESLGWTDFTHTSKYDEVQKRINKLKSKESK
jgi:hypothetical protein